jgi:hypothetical protein
LPHRLRVVEERVLPGQPGDRHRTVLPAWATARCERPQLCVNNTATAALSGWRDPRSFRQLSAASTSLPERRALGWATLRAERAAVPERTAVGRPTLRAEHTAADLSGRTALGWSALRADHAAADLSDRTALGRPALRADHAAADLSDRTTLGRPTLRAERAALTIRSDPAIYLRS